MANKPNDTLDIVDLKSGKLVKQIAGQGKVSGVCYAPDLDRVFVGNGAGTCNAFDCKSDYAPAFSVRLADADNVQYHPGTQTVYVGHGKSLTAVDGRAGSVRATLEMPGGVKGFRIDPKAGKVFVVLGKPSALAVVEVRGHKLLGTHPLTKSDAGSPIAHDAANARVYVGCPKKAMVVEFDAGTGAELAAVEIPGGIDDLHFDAKRGRLYASCADGVLAVLERSGGAWKVVAKVETPKNSRTCAWGGDKLYLGVPKGDGREAEVRVFEARPAAEVKAGVN